MSAPSSSRPAAPPADRSRLAVLGSAVADWARTDGNAWLYLAKALLAAFLALGVSMVLDLPAPKTAMTTVFIVMQPQSGAILAKSFYRLAGTVVGLVATLVIIGLFPQQPVLFLLAVALWVAICTAGAARNRNFRSYGFLLAGYTVALIGLPASQQPDTAFMSALTRAAEIVVGIVAAGLVGALVFPRYTGEQVRTTLRHRFASFVDYVAAVLSGKLERAHVESLHTRFVADVIGFEAARSMAVFENHELRRRNGRLRRLNSEFMMASSRFHALHQLMNRLRASHEAAAIVALDPYYRELAPLLEPDGQPVLTAAGAARVAERLRDYRDALPQRILATRAGLEPRPGFPLLDFDTAAELLHRFVSDLHDYAATYGSLASETHERERWIEHIEPKTNLTASLTAGLRAAVVILVAGAFWIETAWPSGWMLVLNGAAVCALASASPQPSATAMQMGLGATLGVAMGMLLMFEIYPHIDGFPMLCVALTPLLSIGLWLAVRRNTAAHGMGYLIFFSFLAGPDNVTRYAPSQFINDGVAILLSMLLAALAFAILLPPTTPWLKRRLFADLRRQVVLACRGRLGASLRARFESGTRDLMHQAHVLSADQPGVQREALRWMFTVLEVGNAILDLRHELAGLPRDPRYAATMPWRIAVHRTRATITALFATPTPAGFDAALAANGEAIAATRQAIDTFAPPAQDRHRLERVLRHLHFVRTALLDRESPLAALDGRAGVPLNPGAPS
ncbi:FUSC family protein [Burkholderia glumae]|uniref:FUSC family protein n=1 Tax=Burkholderia glumae TaxID=337 RepID=UPI0020367478|nr:FUSC family protein [Burkholderia glumae]MCM2482988.1 FUSC family protein [Burkholderia glumae]MCM2506304.1 FUSC family protein [Burkholderia glumae]